MAQGRGMILVALVLAWAPGCERKAIPPRAAPTVISPTDPDTWLRGGKLVFEDNFERKHLGPKWQTEHKGWVIRDGEVRDHNAQNKGLWLKEPLPDKVRVEFDLRSDPREDGKPFAGDVKVEIFAATPEHEGGYVLINGGWGNRLDVMARLDEHGEDRLEQPAVKVEEGVGVRWAVVRHANDVLWFRNGALHMTYEDSAPVRGSYLGLNNWLSNVAYDNLRIYDLGAEP